jgi:type IV pilus assembly protein PilE
MNRKHTAGFTLIELMIVVVIVGILASVALPAYREHVIRGNRAAAQAMMMNLANSEQQYMLSNRVYADDADLAYTLPDEVVDNYTADITVGTDTVPSFLITFTAIGAQAGDGDLTLDSEGTKTPAEKWQR